jgi:hypothetical protein
LNLVAYHQYTPYFFLLMHIFNFEKRTTFFSDFLIGKIWGRLIFGIIHVLTCIKIILTSGIRV